MRRAWRVWSGCGRCEAPGAGGVGRREARKEVRGRIPGEGVPRWGGRRRRCRVVRVEVRRRLRRKEVRGVRARRRDVVAVAIGPG
jgi:hypothetical protein